MKKLVLSFELSWRTKGDKKFMQSSTWKKQIRPRILARDNYTCQYCGYKDEKSIQVNHIDGNPKNHDDRNLETVCKDCHMITHSGLWCAVFDVIDLFEQSKYSQNEIIQLTRKMRNESKTDSEIIEFLGLRKTVEWKQDLEYLSKLYGFISSRKIQRNQNEVTLTEEHQKFMLENKNKW